MDKKSNRIIIKLFSSCQKYGADIHLASIHSAEGLLYKFQDKDFTEKFVDEYSFYFQAHNLCHGNR